MTAAEETTAAHLLEVRDLHTEFPSEEGLVRAVDGVSFHLDRGETLGIVGESGSGKSVTVMSVMRLIRAPGRIASGQVLFRGRDLSKLSEREMEGVRGEQIAMIFQDPMTSLNPVFRTGWQVGEPLRLHEKLSRRKAWARAVEMLGRVGIPEAKKRATMYPHEFSGGMRQRAMIAMGLTTAPAVLIADEPTTALDVTIQAQILELLREVNQEFGTATIFITHNLGVVAGMCDRVMVMYAGHVVEEGPTEDVFANPRHPYTWSLLRSIPRLDSDDREPLHPIEGLPPDLAHLPQGCPFHPRCLFRQQHCLEERPELERVAPAPSRGPRETELAEFRGTRRAACWVAQEGADLNAAAGSSAAQEARR